MLVGHVFDFSIVLRSRRRELRLRQDDLADYAGVSRGFIADLEHGKPTVEFGKVLQVMAALNVPMSIAGARNRRPGPNLFASARWPASVARPQTVRAISRRTRARPRRCPPVGPTAS